MSTSHNTAADHADFVANRTWFVIFGVVMLFAVVWAVVGDSAMKIVFAGAAFILFLRAGINFEMSERKLHAHDAH